MAIGLCIAALVIGAGVAAWFVYNKNKQYAYVIPVEEIDEEDLDAYYAFYKKKR